MFKLKNRICVKHNEKGVQQISSSGVKNGYICKTCKQEYMKNYSKNYALLNKQKIKEKLKKWHIENKEHIKKYKKQYNKKKKASEKIIINLIRLELKKHLQKVCKKHNQEKITKFYRGGTLLVHICKKCHENKSLKWKKNNPHKVKAYHKIYQKEYYLKNRERILERIKGGL